MRFKNRWKLYEYINKKPGKVVAEMLWDLGWSCRKVLRHLNKLVKDGLVKLIINYTDHCYFPTPLKELINWEEFNNKIEGSKSA